MGLKGIMWFNHQVKKRNSIFTLNLELIWVCTYTLYFKNSFKMYIFK